MKASHALLGAALILLIVLIAYAVATDSPYAQKSYWMSHFVEDPWKVFRRSAGNFDDAAALAFNRATSRDSPSPSDHMLSATVITRNILAQEHRPARSATGGFTRAAVEHARLRREMFDEARAHYMAALRGLRTDVVDDGRRADAAAAADAANGINAQFVIDAAIGFAFGGLTDMLANDPVLAGLGWDYENLTVFQTPAGVGAVDAPLYGAAQRRLDELVAARRAAAATAVADQKGARGAGVATYVELATQNTDDPQNAHDTGVLACLKSILARLRADQAGQVVPSPGDVAAEIASRGEALSDGRAHRLADVLEVIKRADLGERVVSLGATDGECLGRVWLRSKDPKNAASRRDIQQAVFDALYDCWEEGIAGRRIVCVNGRTSRVLAALILLDWDKRNWEVKKLEQFKNDIFAEAARVIAAEAERASMDADASVQRAGRAYLAKTAAEIRAIGVVPAEAAEKLAVKMRAAVSDMVDAHVRALEGSAEGAIPPYMVESTKQEAMAAVS